MKNKLKTKVQIAYYYYKEGLTQAQISDKLGISRPTVSNMLKEALEEKIVKITIQDKHLINYKQQEHIACKYNLQTVLIAGSNNKSEDSIKTEIGSLCAEYVKSRLDHINSLGVGWGSTIHKFVQEADYLNYPNLSIVPLMGGVSLSAIQLHSNHLVFTLGQKYNSNSSLFYAPAIAENRETKKVLNNSEIVKTILAKAREVDLAIIGIGNPQKSITYREMGYVTENENNDMKKNNIIGDILATFLNEKGESVKTDLSNRMIGPTLSDIKQMKEVLILASGKEKIESVKAVLKLGIINHLIIDQEIADSL